jgi:hypothetical protein
VCPEVVVVACVSRSGRAGAQTGNLDNNQNANQQIERISVGLRFSLIWTATFAWYANFDP